MEDWAYGLIIAICAVAWIHVFVDYRKKLMRVMPGVQEAASRRQEFTSKISESQTKAQDIVSSMDDLRREQERLDDKRREFQEKLNEREMIHLPAGKFDMGSSMPLHEDENPERRVSLKAYCIDRCEVTNLQYKDFIDVTGHKAPIHWRNGTFPQARLADHPVVNVSWFDAQKYAEWVGKRLPTEAEWERAARGDHGNDYPWGKTASQERANFLVPDGSTTPVEKFGVRGASQFGVWDMCGNVGEWVQDWYDPKYYTRGPDSDPSGPEHGQQKVYRGGGYHCNRIDIRAAKRHFAMPSTYYQHLGFRCAMDGDG